MPTLEQINTNAHIDELKRSFIMEEQVEFFGTMLVILSHRWTPHNGRHTFQLSNGSVINLDQTNES